MSEKGLCKQDRVDVVGREATRSNARYISPPVDIFETEEGLTMLADVPGMDETSLQISVEQGVLTLEGQATVEKADRFYHEFSMAGYWRQFQIPETFDVSQATAAMKDGVLTLVLPKAEAAKPRKISISMH